jgi:bifunctional enzyme CysN/CysC
MAIYYFTGQPGSGKTTLGTKLHKFLKTEKRNWRQNVFHIDGDDLRDLTHNKRYSDEGRIENVKNTQMIAEYLHNNGCDVVVSIVAPNRLVREELKGKVSDGDFQEIYVHTTEERERDNYYVEDYESPEINKL